MAQKDETRAERNIRWIERHCRVPEGKDVGKPLRLRDWQQDELLKIYDNPHGTRLVIISFAKKNAKTTLLACMLLLHLAGPESLANSQIPSTAQSKEQAAIIFNLAAKMVRMSPTLDQVITIRDTLKQLYCEKRGTVYKALSAEASTAHGISPVFAVHDELGEVEGPVSELYSAVERSMGAHETPMSVVISSQAATDGDLLSILIDDALAGHDPRIVISLYTVDPEKEEAEDFDIFSEEAIQMANPAYGDFLNAKEVMQQAERAKRIPTEEALFRRYTLNQRVEKISPFITKTVWLRNGEDPLPPGPIYGGLDLSEVNDLTAFVIASPIENQLHVSPTFWLPQEGLVERARKDRVPYDVWEKEGHLKTTPGRSVEYEYVAEVIARLVAEKEVVQIAFDRYNMRHLRPWLVRAGLSEGKIDEIFIEFGQGFVSMGPAIRVTESLLLNGHIRHGNHPVLTMCAANAIVKIDEAGNKKLDKKRSRGRIDGMVALAMAASLANSDLMRDLVFPEPEEKFLEEV